MRPPRRDMPWRPDMQAPGVDDHREVPAGGRGRKTMTLMDMKEGETAVIHAITGGRNAKGRMDGLGIREGKRIRLISAAPFRGPLLVEDTATGGRIMIGRGMAATVEVCDRSET